MQYLFFGLNEKMSEKTNPIAAMPPGAWTFNDPAIADAFDQHVREQLPWYEMATGAVAHIARHYIPEGGLAYDLGASTGNIGRSIADVLERRHARLIPVEPSPDMAALYRGPHPDNLLQQPAQMVDFEPFDFAVLFLTMMFVPVPERAGLLARLRARLQPGGAIVIVDKCPAAAGYVATVLWRLTLAGKMATGCDPAEIVAKELSLGGVQRPLDPQTLGPDALEFFRFGEFAGWIIERGGEPR